jgi:hypothetical protein
MRWKRRSRHASFTKEQRRLVGAYFLHEYSFEAAALFNPSIVDHPDQSAAPPGGRRFILSVRAVGEGHVSSLTFRTGSITASGELTLDTTAWLASIPKLQSRTVGANGDHVELVFSPEGDISERVIFPVTQAQSNGIEDARFVKFDAGGQHTYYATYTAYSGRAIRSELLETHDFLSFRMAPLQGVAALNKGMALFPRMLDGKFAMIARHDNENLYLIRSDVCTRGRERGGDSQAAISLGVRADRQLRLADRARRGLVAADSRRRPGPQVLHRRGPARQGGSLQSSRALARAVVRPEPGRRRGYVPNVVYTCGATRHHDKIILPYAVSDTFCVRLDWHRRPPRHLDG